MESKEYQERMESNLALIERRLSSLFSGVGPQRRLLESMRYSLLSGGKRLRANLTLEFSRLYGGEDLPALQLGCAVELLHTYSLIHDDLPCMDDDDLRRGKPSNHKVYGEWLALLAGDALQAEAFRLIGCADLQPERAIHAVEVLATAAGSSGICGGQYLDLANGEEERSEAELYAMHEMKTALLIIAACEMGAISAGAQELGASQKFGRHLGLAFQVRDDMLNVIGDEKTLGKPVGTDQAHGKRNFLSLYGFERCERIVLEETEAAISAISALPGSDFLCRLARELVTREK